MLAVTTAAAEGRWAVRVLKTLSQSTNTFSLEVKESHQTTNLIEKENQQQMPRT